MSARRHPWQDGVARAQRARVALMPRLQRGGAWLDQHPWVRPVAALCGGLLAARLLPRPASLRRGGEALLRALRLLRP